MILTFWTNAKTVTSVLANVIVIATAIAALIKFRVYNMFSRRYRSELACKHYVLSTGDVVFVADYTIHNTGNRRIIFSTVTLQLRPAIRNRQLLEANKKQTLAESVLRIEDPERRGLFRIEAGERSTFQLRCQLDTLDPVVFVQCQPKATWRDRRNLALYRTIYVRADGGRLDEKATA
jgi:hypothetical protein